MMHKPMRWVALKDVTKLEKKGWVRTATDVASRSGDTLYVLMRRG